MGDTLTLSTGAIVRVRYLPAKVAAGLVNRLFGGLTAALIAEVKPSAKHAYAALVHGDHHGTLDKLEDALIGVTDYAAGSGDGMVFAPLSAAYEQAFGEGRMLDRLTWLQFAAEYNFASFLADTPRGEKAIAAAGSTRNAGSI